MIPLYYSLVLLMRILLILSIVFLLIRWLDFIFYRFKSKLIGNNYEVSFNWLAPVSNFLKLFYKSKPVHQPVLTKIELLTGGLLFLAGSTIFFFIPMGQISLTFSNLHPGLAQVNLLHLTDRPEELLLLIIPVYFILFAGLNPGRRKNLFVKVSSRRVVELFLPSAINITLVFLSIAAATGTLNLQEIITFQANNHWLYLYQLPGLLVFILVFQLFFNHIFTTSYSNPPANFSYNYETDGLARALFAGAEKLYKTGMIALLVVLFLGGWLAPFHTWQGWENISSLPSFGIFLRPFWLLVKISAVFLLFSLYELTSIKLTHRQAYSLLWKAGTTIALLNLITTVLITEIYGPANFRLLLFSFIIFIATVIYFTFSTLFSAPGKTVKLQNKPGISAEETSEEQIY